MLPPSIADRLKNGQSVIADRVADVGVLFADAAGFMPLSETIPPDRITGSDGTRLQAEMIRFPGVKLRVGLDVGPVVADVIGAANSSTTLGATP